MFTARYLLLTKQLVMPALTSEHLTAFVRHSAGDAHVLIRNVPLITQQSIIPVAGYNSKTTSMLRCKY
jgi:hypothetical protein